MTEAKAATKKTKEEIAAAYSSEPWWYDVRGFLILTFAYRSTLGAQLRFFGENMRARHLELACGTGTLLAYVLRWRRWKKLAPVHVTGVDYAETMLAGAMHRFRDTPGIELEKADAGNLPFAEASFDSVNIANSVHCFPDVDAALREAYRVLKPGCTLAANVLLHPRGMQPFKRLAERINAWGMRKGILFTPYDEADVRRRLVAAGFEVRSERITGNTLDVLAAKPG